MDQYLTIPSFKEVSKVLKLDVTSISSFTPVMTKLLQICSDENAVAEDVAKLVETDIGISTRILVTVNSAFHGLKRKISSISEAVVYLGMDEVKRIALSATVFETMIKPGRKKNFDRLYFWRHCLCVANMSRLIAREIGYQNPEEAYMAGLLHDYGKIIFDQQARVNYGDFLRIAYLCSEQLTKQERDVLGMGHDDVGVYYSVRWQLPDAVSLVVNYHHRRFGHLNLPLEQKQLISIISLSNFLSWVQGMGSSDLKVPSVLQPEVQNYIDFQQLDFDKIFSELYAQMENTALFYGFSFPFNNQFHSNLIQVNLKLGIINGEYYFDEFFPTKELASQASDKMPSITPRKNLNSKKILNDTLQAIHDDFGFDRICVMQVIRPSRKLKVIECLIQEEGVKDLTGLCIRIGEETKGFVYSLRNNLPVLIRNNLSAERKILDQFQTQEMIVVPFSSRSKVMGALCMDYSLSEQNITPEIFLRLSMVGNQLGAVLNNALTQRKSRQDSMCDPVTGLFNFSGISLILEKYFQEACKGKIRLSIVTMDLDRFQAFCTQFSQEAGNNILQLVGKILRRISRPSDHIARRKAGSFLAVLTYTDMENAVGFAERVRKEVEELVRVISDRFPGLSLTLSAGISQYMERVSDTKELIYLADKALAQAKERDGNQVVCADGVNEVF